MEHFRKENVTKLFLTVFLICTIIFGTISAIPVYESPTITVVTEEIPDYELSITNDTWVHPERILLANLTPKLEDPSWESSEWRQREYEAQIEVDNDSSTLFFYNSTAVNDTYTWNEYARWSLVWPFAVLNYTELTAEWQIHVIRGNITADSSFLIGRGRWDGYLRASYVDDSKTEMNASAGETITLISSANNFTEEFSTIDVGVLWVDLGIIAAPGSIVAIVNVEVWIGTDEPLSSVTLDFQSPYGQSLFDNPSIVSQWLGTAYYFDFYDDIGDRLSFYLKSISPALPYGYDLMLATRSNQTAYLPPGNYNLTLGWSDEYHNDEYIFNITIAENTSLLMQIPLPFNSISFDIRTNQIPGTVRLSYGVASWTREYFDPLNLTESEDVLVVLPDFGSIFVQLSIPRKYWDESEFTLTSGANSTIIIDFKLVPLFGIYFTSQQVTGMIIASIFAVLSLLMLLYRWRISKDTSYIILIPLLMFVLGLILPWYALNDQYSNVEYTIWYSPILGYRLWHLDGHFLIVDSAAFSSYYQPLLFPAMAMIYLVGFCLAFLLFETKVTDFLIIFSTGIFSCGVVAYFVLGGVPWLGFGCMMAAPILAYFIKTRTEKNSDDIPLADEPKSQTD